MRFIFDRTNRIVKKYIDDDFSCFACGDHPPSSKQLKRIASRFGCIFPREFILHSTGPLGGLYVEVKEAIWPRPDIYDVGPFWSFLYGLHVLGLSPGIPDWMNLEIAAKEFQKTTSHIAMPFLKVIGDANVYVFDNQGSILRWDHEINELKAVNQTFFEVLDYELSELRSRKDKKLKSLHI